MYRFIFAVVALVLLTQIVLAAGDPVLSQVQQALRQQGFYYGQPDGVMGDETEHALRRFQIRNGLSVTGNLDEATRKAILKAQETEPTLPSEEGIDSRAPIPKKTLEEDKRYLSTPPSPNTTTLPVQPAPEFRSPNQSKPKKSAAKTSRPPANLSPQVRSDLPYYGLLYRSPFDGAPAAEQERIIRSVQAYLNRYGYRPGTVDGNPGAETVEALLRYQTAAELPRSGTLDGSTLELMGLLPPGKYRPDHYGERQRKAYIREYAEPVIYPGPSYSFGWSGY